MWKDRRKWTKKEWQTKDPRTYTDYLSLSNENTYAYLMISELIDNSISSCENEYKQSDTSKWPSPLEINFEIKIDNLNLKSIGKFEYYSGISLKFTDNAFGIPFSKLKDSIRLNEVNEDSFSSKNVHGRGLKQSAFYFGMDLKIFTSTSKEDSKIFIQPTKADFLTDAIDLIPCKWNRSDNNQGILKTGTTILIEGFHDKRLIDHKTMKEISIALSSRFGRCIQSGNLIIKWKVQDVEKKLIKKIKVGVEDDFHGELTTYAGFVDKSLIESDDFYSKVKDLWNDKVYAETEDQTSLAKYKQEYQRYYDERIKRLKNSDSNKISVYNFGAMDDTIDIFNKDIVTEGNLEGLVKWVQHFKFTYKEKEKSIPITFWKINQDMTKSTQWRGIIVYEGNRAIKHGPTADEQDTYMSWRTSTAATSGMSANRFGGYFDLLDIDVNGSFTKNDKSNFDLPKSLEISLKKFIHSIWYVYDILDNVGKNAKSKVIEDIENINEAVKAAFSEQQNSTTVINGNVETKIGLDNRNNCYLESCNVEDISTEITNKCEKGITWDLQITPDMSDSDGINGIAKANQIIMDYGFFPKEDTKETLWIHYNPNATIFLNSKDLKNFHSAIKIPILIQLCAFIINLKVESTLNNVKVTVGYVNGKAS